MSTYHNLNNEPELLKTKSKDDAIRKLKYQTEKHDHENLLKSLKSDNENYKKYKSLNKKKVLLINTEILIGSGSTVTSSTLSLINPSVGIVISSSTALTCCYFNHKGIYIKTKITLYKTKGSEKFYYNSIRENIQPKQGR